MPVLTQGVPTRTPSPLLLVENKLDVGSWRFRLTVLDDAGFESSPAELIVRVVQPQPPTGPIGPIRPPVDVRIVPPQPIRPITPTRPARRRG